METLITPAILVLAVAFTIWLITSARFRKDIGKAVTSTITVHSASMVESAEFSRAKSKLDAIQELNDDGYTTETVGQHLKDFDDLFINKSALKGTDNDKN